MIKAYFDGCCEPVNPGGTAAYGVAIYKDGERVFTCSEVFLPQKGREKETSNNVAEYSGFLRILNWLTENGYQNESIEVMGDSKLVMHQVVCQDPQYGCWWKIRKGFYKPLALFAKQEVKKFPKLTGHWIPREENDECDKLSKNELRRLGVEFRIQPES